jgi:hypothetical protein
VAIGGVERLEGRLQLERGDEFLLRFVVAAESRQG